MSTDQVATANHYTATRRPFFAVVAVAGGVVLPWVIDMLFGRLLWADFILLYITMWAITAVLTAFVGIGCTWTVAARGPITPDRAINLLLAVMTLALTGFYVGSNIPHLGAIMSTGELAGPGLDQGLITSIGGLAFGLSLSGLLLWRWGTLAGRSSLAGARRLAVLVLVVLVTVVAAFLSWATYYIKLVEDGLQVVG